MEFLPIKTISLRAEARCAQCGTTGAISKLANTDDVLILCFACSPPSAVAERRSEKQEFGGDVKVEGVGFDTYAGVDAELQPGASRAESLSNAGTPPLAATPWSPIIHNHVGPSHSARGAPYHSEQDISMWHIDHIPPLLKWEDENESWTSPIDEFIDETTLYRLTLVSDAEYDVQRCAITRWNSLGPQNRNSKLEIYFRQLMSDTNPPTKRVQLAVNMIPLFVVDFEMPYAFQDFVTNYCSQWEAILWDQRLTDRAIANRLTTMHNDTDAMAYGAGCKSLEIERSSRGMTYQASETSSGAIESLMLGRADADEHATDEQRTYSELAISMGPSLIAKRELQAARRRVVYDPEDAGFPHILLGLDDSDIVDYTGVIKHESALEDSALVPEFGISSATATIAGAANSAVSNEDLTMNVATGISSESGRPLRKTHHSQGVMAWARGPESADANETNVQVRGAVCGHVTTDPDPKFERSSGIYVIRQIGCTSCPIPDGSDQHPRRTFSPVDGRIGRHLTGLSRKYQRQKQPSKTPRMSSGAKLVATAARVAKARSANGSDEKVVVLACKTCHKTFDDHDPRYAKQDDKYLVKNKKCPHCKKLQLHHPADGRATRSYGRL